MPDIASSPLPTFSLDRLRALLADIGPDVEPAGVLRALVRAGCDRLPRPGHGETLTRWRALAAVAAVDLSLAKCFEGHTDALAILAELHGPAAPAGSIWGVWCAEPPRQRLTLTPAANGGVTLQGTKAWCSGANGASHAIVSGWTPASAPWLAAVALAQPGVTLLPGGWAAPAMRGSGTASVAFDQVRALPVGAPGAYVDRPGFLHGGAGVAACWYGGLARIFQRLQAGAGDTPGNPFRLAHLGAADVALGQARWALHAAAAAIDANPSHDCRLETARARLAVEAAAEDILGRAARALGAGPLCQDRAFAQAMADLPLYIRQSHAERDQAAHGAVVAGAGESAWTL
ncbi:acyl-CoA/acyl-ACP dehydrogenase [Achromobacter ruhlandii]|uniref:acyl-CoA/acyl-ACP dehydrogenase n=1 Tax=Achromobacter ruhlandii TaxID=72557 RepID=UPI000C25D7BB|nr:acyl-CoA/acyl-ACP dehydrogenase [Achromobacter ruhlandii]PJM70093.1 acyl-CoA dehydrogenase [Achromobacter ruhlandii]